MQLHEKPGSPGDVLAHYGTKGMRWGVRKEEQTGGIGTLGKAPVSSLKSGKSLSRASLPKKQRELSERGQRRVEKFQKKADASKTKISELRSENEKLKGSRNIFEARRRNINQQTIKDLERSQQRALKDAQAVKKHKLTSAQKKAIIGGIAVTALIGAGAVYEYKTGGLSALDQSGRANALKLQAAARLRGQKVPFNVNKDLAGKMSAKEILEKVGKPVNPRYSTMGGKMNCRRCTYVHELRRRGFDVSATTSAVGWGQSESGVINALTTEGKDFFSPTSMSQTVVTTGGSSKAAGDLRKIPGVKTILDGLESTSATHFSDSKKVLEEIAKQPNGARGEVVFKFPTFGHSMHYEIINGKPHIFDSQKGTMYDASKRVESKWDGFTGAEIRRLDDMDLDLKFLSRWATNN